MIYAINIYNAPNAHSSKVACQFATQLILSGHQIHRLFFFGDGVNNLLAKDNPLANDWQTLITDNHIDSVACVASLKSRHPEAEEKPAKHLITNASVAGLGQYIDSLLQADRVLNFGG